MYISQLLINNGTNMNVTDNVSYHNQNKLTQHFTYLYLDMPLQYM